MYAKSAEFLYINWCIWIRSTTSKTVDYDSRWSDSTKPYQTSRFFESGQLERFVSVMSFTLLLFGSFEGAPAIDTFKIQWGWCFLFEVICRMIKQAVPQFNRLTAWCDAKRIGICQGMRESIKRILQKRTSFPMKQQPFLSDPQWYPHLPWIELVQMYCEIS